MDNVESKLGNKVSSLVPGMKKARPKTISEATASLQKNIDDLNYVAETRQSEAERKAKKIERLSKEKEDDERESVGAKRLAEKLNDFLFGTEDSLEA